MSDELKKALDTIAGLPPSTSKASTDDAALRAFDRIETLRKALFLARDSMRVMQSWIKLSDPAAYSWACERISDLTGVLKGEPAPEVVEYSTGEYKRMFEALCCDMGAINKELGVSPDESGGADAILNAIKVLKRAAYPAKGRE